MFKFVSKGGAHDNEAALFYNGQRIMTMYTTVFSDGEVIIRVEDGSDFEQAQWHDWIEDFEESD